MEQGYVVICAFVSPAEEKENRQNQFYANTGFMNTSLEVCFSRDAKGIYKNSMGGSIENFTGISSPYEIPMRLDYIANCKNLPAEEIASAIIMKFNLISNNS